MKPGDLDSFLDGIYRRRAEGIKLGLDRVETLLDHMGHPERELAVIHIAGTNGKGTVAALLESICRAAGYRTGLYTSPHLVRFNERFRIDGEAIDDETLCEILEEVDGHADAVASHPGGGQPTFFEFATAAAFACFRRAGVRLAILETGLGGRLDATNVVHPLVSVITSIGIDHTGFLGENIVGIAREKAGIIKPGRPVVCGAMEADCREEIVRIARERGAPCMDAEEAVSVQRVSQDLTGQRVRIEGSEGRYPVVTTALLGRHQLRNLATAVATAETLQGIGALSLPADSVCRGLETASWPARMQVLREDPPVILDAAHNPAGAAALRASLRELMGKRPIGIIAAVSRDKDAGALFRALAPVDRVWCVTMRHERAAPASELAAVAEASGISAEAAVLEDALADAAAWAGEVNGAVCLCGSIYFAGEILAAWDALQARLG